VIIAAYEVAGVIEDAVRSALEQTVPPLEVVVSDDGSSDGLEEALAPYRDDIVFLRNEHRGVAAARNAAVEAASGDFVVVLDADDAFLPERLEALGQLAAARPDLDLLTTDAYLEANGKVVRRCYDRTWRFPVREQRLEIVRRNYVFPHAAVRRERLRGAGGFDESIRWTSDWECWIRLVLGGAVVGLVAEALSSYRIRATGLSANELGHLRGTMDTLAAAARHPGLRPAEKRALEQTIEAKSFELTRAEARSALIGRDPAARQRALEVARGRGHSLLTRGKALVSAAVPKLAGELLQRRERRTFVAAAGIRVQRPKPATGQRPV
jgi:GT2 family glycosyltransferase